MTQEDSYQPGDNAFYYEFGRVDRVEVIENMCDSDKEQDKIRYKLRVIENITKSKNSDERDVLFNPVGLEFECVKLRKPIIVNGREFAVWRLKDSLD